MTTDVDIPRPQAPVLTEIMADELALGCSPADWVADHAWAYDTWPYGGWEYTDPALDAWVREVTRILFTPELRAAAERGELPGQRRRGAVRRYVENRKRARRLKQHAY
jgi:hypothetical protein